MDSEKGTKGRVVRSHGLQNRPTTEGTEKPSIFAKKRSTDEHAKEPDDKIHRTAAHTNSSSSSAVNPDSSVAHLLAASPAATPAASPPLPAPILPRQETVPSDSQHSQGTRGRSRSPDRRSGSSSGSRPISEGGRILTELKKSNALTISGFRGITEATSASSSAAIAANERIVTTLNAGQQQQNVVQAGMMQALEALVTSIGRLSMALAQQAPVPPDPLPTEPPPTPGPAAGGAAIGHDALRNLDENPAALIQIEKQRGELTDTHTKGLVKVQRAFKQDLTRHIRQCERVAKLRGEVEVLDRPEGYPNGIKELKTCVSLVELDTIFSATRENPIAVEFTLPKDTTRRDALRLIHRQALRLSKRIELEAAVEAEAMKQSKTGKQIFLGSCAEVEDEIHTPAEVPPGMEMLREPKMVTNQELYAAKIEELFTNAVEVVIKEWQHKRLRKKNDQAEVAAGNDALIHTSPGGNFKDLVNQLVDKKTPRGPRRRC